jgi:hypothetical protein
MVTYMTRLYWLKLLSKFTYKNRHVFCLIWGSMLSDIKSVDNNILEQPIVSSCGQIQVSCFRDIYTSRFGYINVAPMLTLKIRRNQKIVRGSLLVWSSPTCNGRERRWMVFPGTTKVTACSCLNKHSTRYTRTSPNNNWLKGLVALCLALSKI